MKAVERTRALSRSLTEQALIEISAGSLIDFHGYPSSGRYAHRIPQRLPNPALKTEQKK
ncbi:MAG: hypothetical protein KF832_07185 [Caldilineaceae bacterium]|nr:hypothetical protein [Caldilineaceae bacterium]